MRRDSSPLFKYADIATPTPALGARPRATAIRLLNLTSCAGDGRAAARQKDGRGVYTWGELQL